MKKLTLGKPSENQGFGVCQGISDYFNIDVTLLRFLFIVFVFSGWSPFIYFAAYVAMPHHPKG